MRMEFALVNFSYTSFKVFKTQAFNSNPLAPPIEVSDRAQLRNLLRENRMVEQGPDAVASNYFGSDPKSVPTLQEIGKFSKSGGDPKSAKLVKTGNAKDWEKLEKACEQTNFGRASSKVNPEFIVGRP